MAARVLLRCWPKEVEILNTDKGLRAVGECETGAGGSLHLGRADGAAGNNEGTQAGALFAFGVEP